MSRSQLFGPRPLALVLTAWLALDATVAGAQSLPRPDGWRVRVDGAATDTVYYVQMPPGWHMTTGPGALLYDPDNRAQGRYAVESGIHLFPGTSQSGYGIFVGGRELEGAAPHYVAFVIRRDGRFALERVAGDDRTMLVPWTASPQVHPHPGGDDTAHNVIRINVESDSLILEANGARVAAIVRPELPLDGVFGFRAGADVNLHATTLDHLRRLAPAPRKR